LVVKISGKNVSADDDLRSAFRPYPPLTHAWEQFQFGGHLDFQAQVQRPLGVQGPESEARILQEMEIEIDAGGAAIQPRFFPLAIRDLSGHLYYHDNRLELTQWRASHGQAQLALKSARINLGLGGGFNVDLDDLQAQQLTLDDEF